MTIPDLLFRGQAAGLPGTLLQSTLDRHGEFILELIISLAEKGVPPALIAETLERDGPGNIEGLAEGAALALAVHQPAPETIEEPEELRYEEDE